MRTARRTGRRDCRADPASDASKTVYTVLRSPHVDKKSREQFEIRVHKRLIDITHRPPDDRCPEKLDLPAGVDIEIKT